MIHCYLGEKSPENKYYRKWKSNKAKVIFMTCEQVGMFKIKNREPLYKHTSIQKFVVCGVIINITKGNSQLGN